MKTADRVFLRSRVELAAEYELSMNTFERTLTGMNIIFNLPFMVFSYPLYKLIKNSKGEEMADNWMNSRLFLGSLAGWGGNWKKDVLPFQFIYGPLYFLVRLTMGRAVAQRVLPDNFLEFKLPKIEEDDSEKRMKRIEKQLGLLLAERGIEFNPDAEGESDVKGETCGEPNEREQGVDDEDDAHAERSTSARRGAFNGDGDDDDDMRMRRISASLRAFGYAG